MNIRSLNSRHTTTHTHKRTRLASGCAWVGLQNSAALFLADPLVERTAKEKIRGATRDVQSKQELLQKLCAVRFAARWMTFSAKQPANAWLNEIHWKEIKFKITKRKQKTKTKAKQMFSSSQTGSKCRLKMRRKAVANGWSVTRACVLGISKSFQNLTKRRIIGKEILKLSKLRQKAAPEVEN